MKRFITHSKILTFITFIISYIYTQVGFEQKDFCLKFNCVEDLPEGRCFQRGSLQEISVSSESCPDDEDCDVSEDYEGICYKKLDKLKRPLYPGESCDFLEKVAFCAFGPKICDVEERRCRGYNLGEKCTTSADCNPQLYCNRGICHQTLPYVIFYK